MDGPTKVVIDCSGEAADPGVLEQLRRDAFAALQAGDVDRAQELKDRHDAAAKGVRVTVAPLTKTELEQRAADEQQGRLDRVREARVNRDAALAASDWTQTPDAPLTAAQVKAWQKYRQALRDHDYTTNPENPLPTPPGA